MRPLAFLLALPLAACGSADKKDQANAGTAKSLLAEAALIVELEPRIPATYSERMREATRQQLATLAGEARSGGGPDGPAIAALATLPAAWHAGMLRQRAAQAGAIEDRIEARLEAR